MNNENDNRIKIRLEIDIPTCCGKPEIDVSQTREEVKSTATAFVKESPSRRRKSFIEGINVPLGSAWAEWDGGAGTGRVCAAGEAIDGDERAEHVILKIEPGQPGVHPTMPANPIIPVNQQTGTWGPYYMDGVTDHPNQTPHAIYCWAKFDHGYVQWAANPFTPIWTAYPYCDYPSHAAKTPSVPTSKTPSFDILPKSWTLETTGFTGKPIAVFNGFWELAIRPGVSDRILYCNGGNGTTIPKVQMHCELQNPDQWKLMFELEGKTVTYHVGNGEFDVQSANVFKNATTSGVDEFSGIPAAVKVTPN